MVEDIPRRLLSNILLRDTTHLNSPATAAHILLRALLKVARDMVISSHLLSHMGVTASLLPSNNNMHMRPNNLSTAGLPLM